MSVRGCGRPVDDFAGLKPAKATTEPAGENSNPIIQMMIVRTTQAQNTSGSVLVSLSPQDWELPEKAVATSWNVSLYFSCIPHSS